MEKTYHKTYKKKKKLGSYPYASVVFSIFLALFAIGLFGLLLLHTNQLSELIRENVEIQVYLDKEITESQKLKLEKTLSGKSWVYVKEGEPQLRFISKKEAAQKFIEETGEDFLTFLGENPLRDAFTIKIQPTAQSPEQMKRIQKDIERMNGVYEVTYIENLIASINKNVTRISLVLLSVAILMVLTVMVLINNTIKLALFSQRFLIRSMQLVGATGGFIQRPFLRRSLLHGFFAGLLASVVLLLLLQYANQVIVDLQKLQNYELIAILCGVLILIGMLISVLSTYRAINKYLKLSLDDLY
jgi:cell division transport system permease protein